MICCSCKRRCHIKIDNNRVEEMRAASASLKEPDRSNEIYEKMKKQFVDEHGAIAQRLDEKFTIDGIVVCRRFWEYCNSVWHSTTTRMKKLLSIGHANLPKRGPRHRRGHDQFIKADAWLFQLWTDLADNDPTANVGNAEDEPLQIIESADHLLMAVSVNISGKHYAKARNLNPGRFEDIYQMYAAANGRSPSVFPEG